MPILDGFLNWWMGATHRHSNTPVLRQAEWDLWEMGDRAAAALITQAPAAARQDQTLDWS